VPADLLVGLGLVAHCEGQGVKHVASCKGNED
jgi:hypothetical protein